MSVKVRLAAALALIVSMFSVTLSASAFHDETNQYHPIANGEFEEVWERTDRPVAETEVARTWIWGPGGFSDQMTEEYDDAEGGEREVQYFDKSRMELNGDTDENSPWNITQGRLAYELMTGHLQLGDHEEDFEQYHPSHRSAAGDPQDDTAPTYEIMGELIDRDARDGEDVIVQHVDRGGNVTEDADSYADYGVTDVEGDWQATEGIDKNIASVFWNFMNSESTVYEGGEYVQGDLFLNAFYAVGYPLTDAFWADVMVQGEVQDVLIQCFERRCLTYTPANQAGWQVESGNIGQHYYDWRYEQIDRDAPAMGTFTTVEGESSATIDVGEDVTLTANVVSGQDEAVENAPVYFHVIEGDDDAVSLNPDRERTDAEGNAQVTVTGDSEGSAMVQAFADMNDNGSYDLETDIGLGNVDIQVGDDENGEGVAGTFTFDGESSGRVEVGEDITLTAHVEESGEDLEDVEVLFWSQEDDEDAIISLDNLSGTTGADGIAEVTVTGEAEGEATVHAFVDQNDDGVFQDDEDLALGSVDLIVGPTPPDDFQDTASTAEDVTESEDWWRVDIFLNEEDRPDNPFHPGNAEEAGDLTEIIYERPNGTTMTLGAEGTNASWWERPDEDSQYAAGEHVLYYEVEDEWYALSVEFDSEGELIAVNDDPYGDNG